MKKPKLLKTALTAALAATLLLPCAAAGAEMSAKEGAAEQPAMKSSAQSTVNNFFIK